MRKKTPRKNEFLTLPNALPQHPGKPGAWHEVFGNRNPIILEVGCGKAEFAVALAQLRPDCNIIAMDNKSDRLWFGARLALRLGVHNLRVLRAPAEYLDEVFGPGEVDAIWITFPDPFPKKHHAQRRLTAPFFQQFYERMLKPGGLIQFKTDNAPLFDYSLGVLAARGITPLAVTRDLHHSEYLTAETGLLTAYERRFLAEGLQIHYAAWRIPKTFF